MYSLLQNMCRTGQAADLLQSAEETWIPSTVYESELWLLIRKNFNARGKTSLRSLAAPSKLKAARRESISRATCFLDMWVPHHSFSNWASSISGGRGSAEWEVRLEEPQERSKKGVAYLWFCRRNAELRSFLLSDLSWGGGWSWSGHSKDYSAESALRGKTNFWRKSEHLRRIFMHDGRAP